jgi:hypothetical protein
MARRLVRGSRDNQILYGPQTARLGAGFELGCASAMRIEASGKLGADKRENDWGTQAEA